ncbi:MAG: glycosyltransferase family 2 protein [Planctomycetota bacterium]
MSVHPGVVSGLRASVVVPTYGREAVLCDTVAAIMALEPPPLEVVVVDQTPQHEPATAERLEAWTRQGPLRWLRRDRPCITAAMNHGLLEARGDVVLFLDDDVVPDPGLVAAHVRAHEAAWDRPLGIVAGRVVQPWDDEATAGADGFSFAQHTPAWIEQFMGGNFSLRRELALELGGFDECFEGAAYRFEAELAHRTRAAGWNIRFEPEASLHHLHASSGGTRAAGHHLRTWRAHHAVGAYYYLLRSRPPNWLGQMLLRPLRSIRTRHHLRRPWWILPTLVAETRGWWRALALRLAPPRTLPRPPGSARSQEMPPGATTSSR